MIDIGLSQIALIGAVALVVVGPERLPRLARMSGKLFGRAQRYINDIKSEVSREVELEQLRTLRQDIQESAGSIRQALAENASQPEREPAAASASPAPAAASDRVPPASARESFASFPVAPERIALTPEWVGRKAKHFRQNKLARASAIPAWHKRQHGRRTCASSNAARAAQTRAGTAAAGFFRQP